MQAEKGKLMSVIQKLEATPLFKGVNLELIQNKLDDWCHIYQNDQALCRQGESAESLIILLSGTVSIRVDATHILTRTAPEILGELRCAGGPKHRTASVIAIGTV